MSMNQIQPIRPIAPYLGGKRNLARRICAIIDRDAHETYAEPFVGMGGVFLRRRQRPGAEFINDGSREVYVLFRMLQEHYVAFLDFLRFQITTQANFERLVAVDPDTLTDLQRAARFFYLQRLAFGGKISGRNFGVAADRPARFNLTTLEPDLEALHTRLAGVTVINLDYAAFIDRLDRPGTLFYLDPPYFGNEGDYGKNLFTRARFEEMAHQLGGLKGRFLLSLNDHPCVREIFGRFDRTEVRTSYSIGSGRTAKAMDRAELIISNWTV